MRQMTTFKVKATQFGRGTVEMDGQELANVRAFSVRVEAGKAPIVTVEFVNSNVEIEGQIEVPWTAPGKPE